MQQKLDSIVCVPLSPLQNCSYIHKAVETVLLTFNSLTYVKSLTLVLLDTILFFFPSSGDVPLLART